MILKKIKFRSYTKLLLIFLFYLTSCSSDQEVNVQEDDVQEDNVVTDASDSSDEKTGYVEYLEGTLPIIISVPHGGYLVPFSVPDRNCSGCLYIRDSFTQELARSIRTLFFEQTGSYPHVIINLLDRIKLDANRDLVDAADGSIAAEKAWEEYHAYIDDAKSQIGKDYNRGLFIDLHGHAHEIQRLELGYLLTKDDLKLSDSELNSLNFQNKSSIKVLADDNLQNLSFSEVLRGENSLGTLFYNNGTNATPSINNPFTLDEDSYFSGGFNTEKHGSLSGGIIDAVQIECHQDIRFDDIKREQFASIFVKSVREFMLLNYDN